MPQQQDYFSLVEAISGFPVLEKLHLVGDDHSGICLPVHLLVDHLLNLPLLKDLHLESLGNRTETLVTDCQPQKLKARTGSVTSLCLYHPLAAPEIVQQLLNWPAHLTEVSLDDLYARAVEPYNGFSSTQIQKFLETHRQSLKKIKLGVLSEGRDGIPDFSTFPLLTELVVSDRNIMRRDTPSEAATKLGAPQLLCLTIKFDAERTREFDWHHETWMVDFARKWEDPYPRSALKTVFIDIDIDGDPYERRNTWGTTRHHEAFWPWARLSRAQKRVGKYGIRMHYFEGWPLEEWEYIVLDLRYEEEVAPMLDVGEWGLDYLTENSSANSSHG